MDNVVYVIFYDLNDDSNTAQDQPLQLLGFYRVFVAIKSTASLKGSVNARACTHLYLYLTDVVNLTGKYS